MPQIREYENKVTSLSPSETGINAMQRVAQHAAQIGSQEASVTERAGALQQGVGAQIDREGRAIGGAVDASMKGAGELYRQTVEQPALARASVEGVKTHDMVVSAWNDIASKAPLNDKTVGPRFKDEVLTPMLDDYIAAHADTEAGRQHAEQLANHIRESVYQKIGADQATRAKEGVVSDLATVTNTLSDTVTKDPHSFATSVDMARASAVALVQSTPYIDAGTAAKVVGEHMQVVGRQLAQAAISGMINNGQADEAERRIRAGDYKEFIDGSHEMQLVKQAKSMQRMEANSQRLEQDRQKKEAVEKAQGDILGRNLQVNGDIVSVNPQYYADVKSLLTQGAPAHSVFTMLSAGRAIDKDAESKLNTRDDPATYSHLLDRFSSEDKPSLDELNMYRASGQLGNKSFTQFTKWASAKDPEQTADLKALKQGVFDKYAGYISKSNMMTKDPQGDQKLAEFKTYMTEQFQEMKKSGSNRADIIAKLDTVARETLAKFQVSPQQAIQGTVDRATTGAKVLPDTTIPKAGKQPGESTDDYLRRIGAK